MAGEGEQRWQQRVCPGLQTSTRMCQSLGPPDPMPFFQTVHSIKPACPFYGLIYPLPCLVKPRARSPLGWLQPFAPAAVSGRRCLNLMQAAPLPFFFLLFLRILVKQADRARSCIISGSRSLCLHGAVPCKAVPG